jgi:hypothetical protein
MYLDVNEYEYNPIDAREAPQENGILKIKNFCLKFLENEWIEGFLYFIIALYTLFTLLNLMNK